MLLEHSESLNLACRKPGRNPASLVERPIGQRGIKFSSSLNACEGVLMRRREPYCLIRADSARSALALFLAVSASWAESPRGADIFEHKCATCHRANSSTRAPLPEVLRQMPRDSILRVLESGAMKPQGDLLSAPERAAVAEYLAGSNAPATNAPATNVPVAN